MEALHTEFLKRVEIHLASLPQNKGAETHEMRLIHFKTKCVEILNEIMYERNFDPKRKEEVVARITPVIISLAATHISK